MTVRILQGDCRDVLKTLPDESVHCVVTSPPYWGLRDYGHAGQLGLEARPSEYVDCMVAVFADVRRVLRGDGTLWLNLGDSYNAYNGAAGPSSSLSRGAQSSERPALPSGYGLRTKDLKPKDLVGIPWRVALALQEAGWWLRQDIIWSKPNPMPESVRDRCTKSHEYLFMLAKSERYYYDQDAIKEPAIMALATPDANGSKINGGAYGRHVLADAIPEKQRRTDKQRGHSRRHAGFNDRWDAMEKAEQCGGMRNKRSVWTVGTSPFPDAHFATFPPSLIEPCILAGCPVGGTVLDPFGGAGTTGLVADRKGRNAILIELNPAYADMARKRIHNDGPLFADVA